jgi:class 3 adenylate cyclase
MRLLRGDNCCKKSSSAVPFSEALGVELSGIKRKLAVILTANFEGLTSFTRAEEEVTLKTLGVYREIIDRLIARHDGRVFGAAGDSVLVEFHRGAVEAVR